MSNSPPSDDTGNQVRAREGEAVGAADSAEQVRARECDATENNELRQIAVENWPHANDSRQLKRRLSTSQRAFLAAYPLTATIQGAADASGVHRCRHYRWLKTSEDYKAAFAEAVDEAAEKLEDAARHRAVEGLRRYRFTKAGEPIMHPETGQPYYEHVYSDNLLMFLLKGLRPDKYRENLRVDHSGTEQVRVTFDADWYGNHAHDRAAEAIAAPTPDSSE